MPAAVLRGGRVLNSGRFSRLMYDRAQRFEESRPLRYLARTPVVPADDDELTGIFTGRIFAADIITDDQEAVTYEAGQFEIVTNNIPNLKVGQRFTQGLINRLNRIASNLGTNNDLRTFLDWQGATIDRLILGVRMRMNALIAAMMFDDITYSRLGVQITASWGMPSDLKFSATAAWTNAGAATPITDIMVARDYAADTYGEAYDRITLTRANYRNLVKTAEFQALIPGALRIAVPANAFNARDPRLQEILLDVLQMQVEIDDTRIREQSAAGTQTTTAVTPSGYCLLSSTADDQDPTAMDFGNGVVTESIVSPLIGGPDIGGDRPGPVGYFTGSPELNPPNLRAWGVARGLPRKHRKTATARLAVA
jgi:hypothetical protein